MPDEFRDINERLQALGDSCNRTSMGSDARQRVRDNLRREASQRPWVARLRWWPAAAFVVGAAMVMVIFALKQPMPVATRVAKEAITQRAVDPPSPAVQTPALQRCKSLEQLEVLGIDSCASAPGIRLTAFAPSKFSYQPEQLTLDSGEVLFDIDPRRDTPFFVHAGQASIEVVGTRFIVKIDGDMGSIVMLRGHVRVRVRHGAAKDLRIGARFTWQQRAKPKRQRAKRKKLTDDGLSELLDAVAKLRRQSKFADAVDLLRTANQSGWTRRARSAVSYELGTILDRQLKARTIACAHWTQHRRRFPGDRYAEFVASAQARLECPR